MAAGCGRRIGSPGGAPPGAGPGPVRRLAVILILQIIRNINLRRHPLGRGRGQYESGAGDSGAARGQPAALAPGCNSEVGAAPPGVGFASLVPRGCAAQLRSAGLVLVQTTEVLRAPARDLGAPGLDTTYGVGIVDAACGARVAVTSTAFSVHESS